MYLTSLSLQNFRSYKKWQYDFAKESAVIIGPNTAGKSNLIESIYLLSTGKSFRAEKDRDVIQFGEELSKVTGESGNAKLEILITQGVVNGIETPYKKYLVNDVSKRRVDFAGNLATVLFSPFDLELLIGSPGNRRTFLDSVLEVTDREYRIALSQFIKAIRQRNALLSFVKETGRRNEKLFEIWDDSVISNGQIITKKREDFIGYINNQKKPLFEFLIEYDKSTISPERLFQYKDAEVGAGVTLVGPHRDDIVFTMPHTKNTVNVKHFGSRGQQRLVILQLKLLQLAYIENSIGEKPVLLLDDIFSELDQNHIDLVLQIIENQQTIITSTHEEFIPSKITKSVQTLFLEKGVK